MESTRQMSAQTAKTSNQTNRSSQPPRGPQQPRNDPPSNPPTTAEQLSAAANPQQAVENQNPQNYTHTRPQVTRSSSQRASLGSIPEGSTAFGPLISQSYVRRTIRGTRGDSESLDPRYYKRSSQERFFTFGRVFKVLWFEPNGSGQDNGTIVTSMYGERAHSKIRWFAVIRESRDHCQCLPIQTYGGRGVTKPGLDKEEHAIIYTGDSPPRQLRGELPSGGEDPMRSPIRVVPTSNTMRLDPMSRIHFGRVYTVEKNVKVMDVGTVHPDHLLDLRNHFYHTFLPPSSQGPIAARAGQSDTGALSQVPRAETSQDYAAILRNAGPSDICTSYLEFARSIVTLRLYLDGWPGLGHNLSRITCFHDCAPHKELRRTSSGRPYTRIVCGRFAAHLDSSAYGRNIRLVIPGVSYVCGPAPLTPWAARSLRNARQDR
ncbi:hypothetical protein M8818_000815 [Zalaria obscura]|uniref:Uncharacterized protein n=1 Tax=Zalaria obscura TaxID=2024903 RepID=A0ACC3SNJ1_9PEZI